MKKKTLIQIAVLAVAASGSIAIYAKNKSYYKKYPMLKELRSIYPFTISAAIINPTCMGLINKSFKNRIVENSKVMTTSMKIPTYDEKEIMLNVIQPLDCKEDETLPCMVYYHGGGYVFDVSPTYYSLLANYVNQVRCKIIFPHYRTLFEGSTDTCFEDAFSALVWTLDNAEMLKIDRNKVAVGGDSAGGGLAAAVTHMLRDRKEQELCYQMLIYPVTDSTLSTPSMKKFTDTPVWNAKANAKMWKEMKKRLSPNIMKYVAPILDSNFSDLCDAYVEVEEFDCLHDEGVLYAEKLMNNGYKVQFNDMKGTYHGFDQNQTKLISRQVMETRSRALRKAFGMQE